MSGRRGPVSATTRVERLLKMLPWLAQRGRAEIPEMARQFGLEPAELIRELELAATCGLPPYTPDVLARIVVWDEEGYVECGGMVRFDHRTNLSRDEAFGLALLGSAAGRIGGFRRNRALRSALRKLGKVLGESNMEVDIEQPEFLEHVSAAAGTGERLDIEYWNPVRNDLTGRRITVRRVHWQRGHWYIDAEDDAHGGERRSFRVDRIRSLTPTGEHVPVVPETVPPAPFFTDESQGVRVVLDLPRSAEWVTDEYHCTDVGENPDGSLRVSLIARTDPRWLGRLLLRAGEGAAVVEPAEWTGLQSAAARSLLGRYASGGVDN